MSDIEATSSESDRLFIEGVMECQFSSFCQSNMIRKDPIFKTLMLSRKGMYMLIMLQPELCKERNFFFINRDSRETN